MKDPAFLFYPNDWIGGTMGMTFEEKGAYMELLMLQFNRGHMTTHMIGHVLGQNSGQLWEGIKSKFKIDEQGLYYNQRLEDEQNKRKAYSASRRNNLKGENQYTKKRKQERSYDQTHDHHMTSHMENENENININVVNKEDKDKRVQGEKKKEKKTEPPTWRTDYKIYLDQLREEYTNLLHDQEWLEEKKKFNPGVNIPLSIEKACVEFWATEAGWKHKKKSRSQNLDWRTTLTNALSLKSNRVYETTGNGKTTNNTRKELENLRDLSEAVLQGIAGGQHS